MNYKDTIFWNTMLQAYCTNGLWQESQKFFKEMEKITEPDEFTYAIILKILTETSNFLEGQIIHEQLKVNYLSHIHSQTFVLEKV